MHAEYYTLGKDAARIVNETRTDGGRVVAVGTTTTRTIETCTWGPRGQVRSRSGWTNLFIRPGFEFRVTDALLTNFHLPRSTLLMLVAAFAGYDLMCRAYRVAIDRRYRFYSFGDAMLIL
jgi:S-adenosylmethionine:tRNA ribosyltransferase-isomerase